MGTNLESKPIKQTPWQLMVVMCMGIYWALDFLIAWMISGHGIAALEWLPLLGFASPTLRISNSRLWRRIALSLCIFEVCLSPLFWFGSLLSFMDPVGFRVHVVGITVFTLWSSDEQFVFFAIRGLLFLVATILILKSPRIYFNEADAT